MGSRRPSKKSLTHDVKLSKALSYVLRHGASKEGLEIDSSGFVKVRELLRHAKFSCYTEQDIRNVVEHNEKQRFALKENSGELLIRANQGHSIEVDDLELSEIDYEEIPVAIHGTYEKVIHLIKRDGLSKMSRRHIHMSVSLPEETNVVSGMRHTCDYLVYVNTQKASRDGLKFYKAANGVILCSGDSDGLIHPKYFDKVAPRHSAVRR